MLTFKKRKCLYFNDQAALYLPALLKTNMPAICPNRSIQCATVLFNASLPKRIMIRNIFKTKAYLLSRYLVQKNNYTVRCILINLTGDRAQR